MSRAGDEFGGTIRERSGWLLPLAVFFVTACLAALVLAYYFAPAPAGLGQELPSPTDSPRRISLSVGAVRFRIPASYLPLASQRRGGPMQEVALAAVLPDLTGFTLGVADEFDANAPDSPVVHLTLKSGRVPLPANEKLRRIYLPQVQDEYGQEGPFGLRHYAFRPDSGYRNQELFYGVADSGPVALLCDKEVPSTPSPNCLRDFPIGDGLAIGLRFKRARLEEWRNIDRDVRATIAGFADRD